MEGRANAKDDKKKSRKKEGYGVDSDTDSEDENAAVKTKKGAAPSSRALRTLIKNAKGSSAVGLLRSQMTSAISKKKSAVQLARQKSQGHIEKFSGDAYKSNKGKGDVIKAGKLEPFSYIQLNPGLLNKRKKQ